MYARISFLRENDGVGPYAVAGANAVLYGIPAHCMRMGGCETTNFVYGA